MSNLIPILNLRQSAEAATSWTAQKLLARGFQVEKTFDLQAARRAYADCPCPYHGTGDCSCQITVLIVHSNAQCATVVVHGRDERVTLALGNGSNQSIDRRVIQALIPSP
jgi:hypothetical protein